MSYSTPNRIMLPYRFSIDTQTDFMAPSHTGPAAGTWPTANLAIYVPIIFPCRLKVVSLWIASQTSGTDNVDMALYDSTGVAVISATNMAKTTEAKELVFDVTDTEVGPGLFYIGASCDSVASNFHRWTSASPAPFALGIRTETSAYPLPSTATFSTDQTLSYIPIMGAFVNTVVT